MNADEYHSPTTLWLTFWTHPRQTTRRALDLFPPRTLLPMVLVLALLTSTREIFIQPKQSYGATGEQWLAWGSSLVLTFLLMAYVVPWLIAFGNRWFGGKGSPGDIRIAVALGTLPTSASILLGVATDFVKGRPVDSGFLWGLGIGSTPLFMALGLAILLYVWTLACRALAEAQGYSAWNAFFQYALVWGVFMIVFIPLVVGVTMLFHPLP